MNSLDSNILVYAANKGCDEHVRAKAVYEAMLDQPSGWIISDQVLFESYKILRNPRIFEFPLTHSQAVELIRYLREESGVLHCGYETSLWEEITGGLSEANSRPLHIFDRILAITLLKNGVTCFHTRNVKDFENFGFERIVNPIDDAVR